MKKLWLSPLQTLLKSSTPSRAIRRKSNPGRKRKAAGLESLESRQLLTGDISGTVFHDLNANGVDDPSENGLAGWTVFVDTNGDGALNSGELSTTTDDKGKYAIVGIAAGTAQVYEVVQSPYAPTSGFTNHQTVSIRDRKETRVKFPNVTAPPVVGRIVGTVFEDANENGISESGEDGLTGWTVFVDSNNDGLLTDGEPATVADIEGDYAFEDVLPGPVTVYEIPQGTLRPTVGGLFPTQGASDNKLVNVVAGSTVRANFANITPQIGTIRGQVWHDANGDGIRGAGESAMPGTTVYADLNSNGVMDLTEPSRVADDSGAYSFVDIRTGAYRITEVLPDAWSTTVGRPSTVVTSVFRGGVSVTDFFNLVPVNGSIRGSLWNDADGNGLREASEESLAGWQVYLDVNSNGALDVTDPQTATGADGSYLFSDVPYGNATVREVVPSTWLSITPSTAAATFRLLNGEHRTGVDFGNRERIGTIRGNVWNDANGDRLRGVAESSLNGWTVFLDLNTDGNLNVSEPSVESDAAGNYEFSRVPVGTYRVTEVVPAGWITSIDRPQAVTTNLAIGGVNTVDYFNLVPLMGSVSGRIFSDVDSNGTQGATEAGLEGWLVYADINSNGTNDVSEPQTVTNLAGEYTLTGMPYGNHTIREVVQPGFTVLNHPGGIATTFLLNGDDQTGLSFANHELSEFVINGTAFSDKNRNGVRDAGERALSGITVFLDANNNGTLDAGEQSAVTSADRFFTPTIDETGTYSFTRLARGTYHVREVVPAVQDATPAAARETTVVVPSASQTSDFANVFRDNEIHGVIYDDTDANGVRDAHEYGRPDVSLYVDLDRDDIRDIDEPHTVSGADGSYSFVGLTPGAYIVREDSGMAGPHTYPRTGGGTLWPEGVSHPAVGNVTPSSITTSLSDGQTLTQTVSLTLPGAGSISNMVDVFLLFDDTGSFTANSPIVRAAFPTIISTLQASLPGIDLGFGVGRFEEYGGFAGESAVGRPFTLNQPIVESTRAGFAASIQAALDRMAPGFGGDGPETDIEALYQVVTGLGFDGNNNGTVTDSGAAGLASTQLNPGNSGDVPSFDSFTTDGANNVLAAAGNVGGAGFRPGALPIILTATDIGFAYQPHGETSVTGVGGVTLPLSALTQSSRASTPFSSGAGLQDTITGLNALGALVIGLGTNPEATIDPRQGLEALAQLTGAINRSTSTIANGTADAIAPGDALYFQISNGFGSTVADGITNAIQNAVTNVAMDITLRSSDPRVRIINHTGTLTGIGAGQTATFDVEFIGDGRPRRFDLQFVRQGTEVVLGSIPVVLGTPVSGDGYSYDELEDGEIHQSSHFGNYVANVAPSFVGGSNQIVAEDSGTTTVAGWATGISTGAETESRQVVDFIVNNSNPALFSVQPSIAADGTLTFTPAANASGQAVVTVFLHDNGGVGLSGVDTSGPQTFLIDISPVNDAPVGSTDSYSLIQGETLAVAPSGVLSNDNDADGDGLTVRIETLPANGTVVFNSDGSFQYSPAEGYFGSDSFTYVAFDGSLESAAITVTLNVNHRNSAPVAVSDVYSMDEDTILSLSSPGVLGNDSDADGDDLSVVKVLDPAHGTVVLNADGSIVYTPSLNYRGIDTFLYLVNDGTVDSNVATVTINVLSTNRAPLAGDETYSTSEDTALTVTLPGVLLNDSDADGDLLSVLKVAGPAHGTLTLNADGTFVYTPAANFNGTDRFTYVANDGAVNSSIATVTINVGAVNDAPVATADSYTTTEDSTLTSTISILSNDSDVDVDALTIVKVLDPTHGTLSLNPDGTFNYTPAANYAGADSFSYFVTDGSLNSSTVNVNITVTAINDAPVANDEAFAIGEDTGLTYALPGVLGNDSDADGNALSAIRVTGPAHGTLTLNANGSFVYTPVANYFGTDTFTYRASDGLLTSGLATVTITIASVNDVPVARAESYSTDQDVTLNIAAGGVLSNDTDGDGEAMNAVLVSAPAHGTLTLNADGSFSYVPTPGYSGADSFVYLAADATSSSLATTVNLTVIPFVPGAKFFVVDGDRRATFQYGGDGSSLSNSALTKADSKPRGIASNATGTIQWVIDGAGVVYIYNNTGALLGQWTPLNVGKPEGIAVWGNDLWLVDPTSDRVYKFTGGAALRTGRVAASSNFSLNSGNRNSTDIVTDGAHLWVVNDTLATDKVFRYTTAGNLEGSWTLSTTNPTPTGITIDPNDVNHIWIVDASTDKVYQYNGATSRLTGSQEPFATFSLAATNTNPQGIADPLSSGSGLNVSAELLVSPAAAGPVCSSAEETSMFRRTTHTRSAPATGVEVHSERPMSGRSLTLLKAARTAVRSAVLESRDEELFTQDSNEPQIAASSLQDLDDVFANVALLME